MANEPKNESAKTSGSAGSSRHSDNSHGPNSADAGQDTIEIDEWSAVRGAAEEHELMDQQYIQGRFRYKLERKLGGGGFGTVYLATCEANPTEHIDCPPTAVAVKVISPPHGTNATKLIKRELAALLALRHNRIPRVYDWQFDPPHHSSLSTTFRMAVFMTNWWLVAR